MTGHVSVMRSVHARQPGDARAWPGCWKHSWRRGFSLGPAPPREGLSGIKINQ